MLVRLRKNKAEKLAYASFPDSERKIILSAQKGRNNYLYNAYGRTVPLMTTLWYRNRTCQCQLHVKLLAEWSCTFIRRKTLFA